MTRHTARTGARLLCGLFLSTLAAPMALAQNAANLSPETTVKLVLLDRLRSGSSKKGDRVNLRVDEDVTDGSGNVLIRRGSAAYGTITASRGAKMFGRRGTLAFSVDYTTAVDGQRVPLRANSDKGGKSKGWLSVGGAIVLAPITVLMKGGNASIDSGTIVLAAVDSALTIHAESSAAPSLGEGARPTTGSTTVLVLRNGDRISGQLASFDGVVYTLVTAGGIQRIDRGLVRSFTEAAQTPASRAALPRTPRR